jgi:hypothetical protein
MALGLLLNRQDPASNPTTTRDAYPHGVHSLDDPLHLKGKDSNRCYAADDARLSCKQQVGGSSPPASSQNRRSESI